MADGRERLPRRGLGGAQLRGFQICNQPAISWAFDLARHGGRWRRGAGGRRSLPARPGRRFGRLGANGHYLTMMAQDTHALRDNAGPRPGTMPWCGMLMNMWNRDFYVHAHYRAQLAGLSCWNAARTGRLLGALGRTAAGARPAGGRNDDSDFGWAAPGPRRWATRPRSRGFMRHADRHMAPSWRGRFSTSRATDRPRATRRAIARWSSRDDRQRAAGLRESSTCPTGSGASTTSSLAR